jgi:anti-sigma factor RsiW
MKDWAITIATLLMLLPTLAMAEDFKTVTGKVYQDATVTRVEADGIEIKTKTGIAKVYFTELPQEVQERFHWARPEPPREPFYSRWAAAVAAAPHGDPAVLAKIIAAVAATGAAVGLISNHIRSRRKPTIRVKRASRTRAAHHGRL